MNVTLPPELEKLVADKVGSGAYHSASEVVSQALRLLDTHDALQQQQYQRLKSDVKLGLDQANRGELLPLDIEAIKQEGRLRITNGPAPS